MHIVIGPESQTLSQPQNCRPLSACSSGTFQRLSAFYTAHLVVCMGPAGVPSDEDLTCLRLEVLDANYSSRNVHKYALSHGLIHVGSLSC